MKKKRRAQPKQRKPKYLSLRLQFPASEGENQAKIADEIRGSPDRADCRRLHTVTEEQSDEREAHDAEKNVAFFFSEGDGGATSLNGILDGSAVESNSSQANSNTSRVGDFSTASVSLSHSYREKRAALVRTAMRSRNRDVSGEKWVRYSEVVERKVKDEEVSSSAVDLQPRPAQEDSKATQGPLLKLDYDEIMNAWSNKGPLYVYPDCTQIVPDINNDIFPPETSNPTGVTFGCWAVPELGNSEKNSKNREKMMEQREASVLRYKEKRQNRLFCKKIRYQVRKLNAEKRPRLKGRFVKKN